MIFVRQNITDDFIAAESLNVKSHLRWAAGHHQRAVSQTLYPLANIDHRLAKGTTATMKRKSKDNQKTGGSREQVMVQSSS